MIRNAAQVTAAQKLSKRFHRETLEVGDRTYRFLAMAPTAVVAHSRDRDTARWLSDDSSAVLVAGTAGRNRRVIRTVMLANHDALPLPERNAHPVNADTAVTDRDRVLGKDDPDPRTGERVYYGEALEVNGEWWRFWALAPVNTTDSGTQAKFPRWFTNGRQFGLVTGPQGKGTLVRVMT